MLLTEKIVSISLIFIFSTIVYSKNILLNMLCCGKVVKAEFYFANIKFSHIENDFLGAVFILTVFTSNIQ